MKRGEMASKQAKKGISLVLLFLIFTIETTLAQSPYAIAPKWYFGRRAGMDFSGGAPVVITGGQVDGTGQEASTTMCDANGDVLFYSDGYRLYDGNHAFKQFVNGGTSSTNAGVAFPDPADPTNLFYYVTANQHDGGGGDDGNNTAQLGIFYYHIQRTGTGTFNVIAGPTLLSAYGTVSEQLYAGTDNNNGYWVVSHQGSDQIGGLGNQFRAWNFTSSGVGATQTSFIAGTDNATQWQGSIKINKCQNKLAAVYWSGRVEVYDWNNTTGTVTALTNSYTIGSAFGYGCEFSPDGTKLYFTSLVGNQLYQMDLGTNVVTTFGGSSNNITEMGTIQIGPDDKLYVTNVANYAQPSYIGVVNDPNLSGAACNYSSTGFVLNNSVGNWPNIYRGIANQAWINPLITMDTIGACRILGFNYDFSTYYGAAVSVVANSEEWDFGDGSGFVTGLGATPSHTYAAGGTYTVQLRVTDATCNKVWTISQVYTVNGCSTPPPICTSNITAQIAPVSTITLDETNAVTVNFSGSSSIFDGGNPAAQQYFWNNGTPDTTNNVLSITNATSLTFQANGNGGNLPQGNYTVYLIIRQGLCMDTTSVQFDVTYTPPLPPGCYSAIDADINAITEILLEGTLPSTVNFSGAESTFDNANTTDLPRYFWSLNTPDTLSSVLSTTNNLNLTFAYNSAGGYLPQGEYDIYLIIKQGYCIDTAMAHLNVIRFFIPNLVTPNGDSFNDKFEISNIAGRFDVEVYNRWGDRVYVEKGYTDGWNLGDVSDGVYYFNIIDALSEERYKGWVQVMH